MKVMSDADMSRPLGMHLADASVFVSCAMTLSVFDISKYVQDGQVVEPVYEAITGTIRFEILFTVF